MRLLVESARMPRRSRTLGAEGIVSVYPDISSHVPAPPSSRCREAPPSAAKATNVHCMGTHGGVARPAAQVHAVGQVVVAPNPKSNHESTAFTTRRDRGA